MRKFRREAASRARQETAPGKGGPKGANDAPPPRAPFAALMSLTFVRADARARAHLLRALLAPLGPLALAGLAGGAFAKYLTRLGADSGIEVSLTDAAATSSRQVLELARYLEQSDPQMIDQFWSLLGPQPLAVAAVAATVVAVMVRVVRMRRERGAHPPGPGR